MKLAVVTVSSDSFLPGTEVLFHSFLQQNPWYKGEFVVIDGGLSPASKDKLSVLFNTIIKPAGKHLEDQLQSLISSFPAYAKTKARFYSIEAFNFNEYDCVIYLDSDILCTGNIEHLFNSDSAFSACADHRYYTGYSRNKKTFRIVLKNGKQDLFNSHFITKLFNTGVMVINNQLVGPTVYNDLIKAINTANYEHIQTGHTDTVVLNKLLLGSTTWLPLEYNFYSPLFEQFNDKITRPFFVHFMGKYKPWNSGNIENKWFKEWNEIQKHLHGEG